jgi:peptide/nickel transport system permease protein
MRSYVAKRLAWTGVVTLLVLTLYFVMLDMAPGGGETVFAFQAASSGGDPEAAEETFRRMRGLDRPLHVRYVDYMTGMLTGDWGWSTTRSQPVLDALAAAYPYSLQYAIPSTIISIIVGYGIGLYSATHQYELGDYLGTFVAFFGISIPNFWFAIMAVLIFAVQAPDVTILGAQLLPLPSFYQTGVVQQYGWISWENTRQLLAPVVVVSTASIAGNMRYSRAEALEYVHAEFVKTARAKGASNWRTLTRHILRPAMVPLMTIFIADILGLFFAGAFFVEVVFQIPGLAQLAFNAIINQDTALVMGTTLIPVFIFVVGNLLQDIAYTVLDPRIDYGDR